MATQVYLESVNVYAQMNIFVDNVITVCDGVFVYLQLMPLADHLTCPVCMGRLQNTHMTACGHRYCEKCIRECIDRLRRCPCCNAALQHNQLIKDTQFDALIGN